MTRYALGTFHISLIGFERIILRNSFQRDLRELLDEVLEQAGRSLLKQLVLTSKPGNICWVARILAPLNPKP